MTFLLSGTLGRVPSAFPSESSFVHLIHLALLASVSDFVK